MYNSFKIAVIVFCGNRPMLTLSKQNIMELLILVSVLFYEFTSKIPFLGASMYGVQNKINDDYFPIKNNNSAFFKFFFLH